LGVRILIIPQVCNFRDGRCLFRHEQRLETVAQLLTKDNLVISDNLANDVEPRRERQAQLLGHRLRIGSVDQHVFAQPAAQHAELVEALVAVFVFLEVLPAEGALVELVDRRDAEAQRE
jgi:hypothetical protein